MLTSTEKLQELGALLGNTGAFLLTPEKLTRYCDSYSPLLGLFHPDPLKEQLQRRNTFVEVDGEKYSIGAVTETLTRTQLHLEPDSITQSH